jgi:hypothetical protein
MTRESAPKRGASQTTAAKRDRSQCTAELRAEALALNTAAVAEGIWPATPEMLDALSHLADAIVWDLAVAS